MPAPNPPHTSTQSSEHHYRPHRHSHRRCHYKSQPLAHLAYNHSPDHQHSERRVSRTRLRHKYCRRDLRRRAHHSRHLRRYRSHRLPVRGGALNGCFPINAAIHLSCTKTISTFENDLLIDVSITIIINLVVSSVGNPGSQRPGTPATHASTDRKHPPTPHWIRPVNPSSTGPSHVVIYPVTCLHTTGNGWTFA